MSAFFAMTGSSIYNSPWSIFWPGRCRLNREVAEMVLAADTICNSILGVGSDGTPAGKYGGDNVSFRHYEELFWDFTRAAVICLGGRVAQDSDIRLIAGIISSIVTLASMHFIGRHWVDRSEALEDEKRVHYERVVRLPSYRQYDSSNEDMRLIKKILMIEEEIFSKIKRNAEYSLTVRISLLVAGFFGVGYATMGTMSMLGIAAVIGVVTTVGWLLAEGLDFSAGERRRSAQDMRSALKSLSSRTTF